MFFSFCVRPGNPCASVTDVSVDEHHNCQYSPHLGVGVAGRDHLENIVVEVIEKSVKVFLRYLPQLSGYIPVGERTTQV